MTVFVKSQSGNKHLQNMGSAQSVHVDGSSTIAQTIVPASRGCSLLRVNLNTNGNTVTLKSGSDVIAVIANDAPEQSFWYGVWCGNGLTVTCGGAVDATIVFDSK